MFGKGLGSFKKAKKKNLSILLFTRESVVPKGGGILFF